MNRKHLYFSKWLVICIAFSFVFTGCASREIKITETGFLSSYADLKEDVEFKGMYVYKDPTVDIAEKYSEIIIAPVQFKLNPDKKGHAIDEENRKKLEEYFVEQLKERLGVNYLITDTPSEKALLFRSAVTGILPNKVYLNLHWSTTLMGAGVGGASMEAEMVDSLTGKRVISYVDARKGKRLNYTKGLTKWGHTKEVLGIWADIISSHLDELKVNHEAGI